MVNCLFYTTATLVLLIQCVRRPGQSWLATASSARCRSINVTDYIQGSFGVVSDIYIFILPLPVLWGLHMAPRKKLGVFATFLTGLM